MNLARCPNSPDPDSWASLPEPLPRSLSPRILTTMDCNKDQSSKKHVWELSEDFRRGQINRITATTRITIAISNECMLSVDEEQASYQKYFMILDHYEMSCKQRAQRLERVCKSSKSQPKSERPKKGLSSLLDRLSIPEPKERAEQSSQWREIQKRSCPVFAQTTHPVLIAQLMSPPPPLSLLS
jgi:hypothetical protein